MSQFHWQRRIKNVEREYLVTRYAIDSQLKVIQTNSIVLPQTVKIRDFETASVHLEGTYIIRLFTEFETCLRGYWKTTGQQKTPRLMKSLINRVASKRHIRHDDIANVHQLREYRNFLVHIRDAKAEAISIEQARKSVCRFLSFLPLQW